MRIKLREHAWAMLLTGLTGFLVFLFFAIVHPTLLVNGDDWGYFGIFSSPPLPRIGAWNVTRLLPEYSMPITGFFSAFLIYPLIGDYLVAANLALAIVMGLAIALLALAFYRFFLILHENKAVCAAVSTMMIVLCFTIFKSLPSGNTHLFDGGNYNIYFFYILPNIFNSITVLLLMRRLIIRGKLSVAHDISNPSVKGVWLLVALYLGIFSMLFSAAMLLAFAMSVILMHFFVIFRAKERLTVKFKNWGTDSFRDNNIAVIIIVGIIIAMILEITSVRSNSRQFGTHFGSLFSIAFLQRIGEAVGNFMMHIRSLNKYTFLIMFGIVAVSAFFRFIDRKRNPKTNLSLGISSCLLAIGFLFPFYMLLAAKAGPKYIIGTRCVYGLFFFVILLIGILTVYLLKRVAFAKLFLPMVITIMVMCMINSLWPYSKSDWPVRKPLVDAQIEALVEADAQGCTEIDLYVPEDFPLTLEVVRTKIAEALYNHHITLNKIKVVELKTSSDGSVYYMPK